jgi:hypothetical protein
MKKGIRQARICIYCKNKVKEYYYKGRFKGYLKTCINHVGYGNKGKLNHSWKGGKRIDQGYVYLLDKNKSHEKGLSRYTGEHILVAENKYGRKIKKDELVHHLNGVRDDNRPQNLVIIKKKGHETWTYVRELQKRIRELEEVVKNAEG